MAATAVFPGCPLPRWFVGAGGGHRFGREAQTGGWDEPRSWWRHEPGAGAMVSLAFRPLGRSQAQFSTSAQGLVEELMSP